MSKYSIPQMRVRGTTGTIRAYFTLAVGPFAINDMRLVVGVNGPFVGFPSKSYMNKENEKKWTDIVQFIKDEEGNMPESTKKTQDEIIALAVKEYEHRTGESIAKGADEDDDLPF